MSQAKFRQVLQNQVHVGDLGLIKKDDQVLNFHSYIRRRI